MPTALILALVLLFVLIIGAFIAYIYVQRTFREQKNFERGLKMVPLLIHLPPQSTDVEGNSRDERDVANETISKAETLYGILSSTVKKGFKSNFYGQRHVAFEIVASKGLIHFYTAVPVVLLELVQQAIVSAYPTARLEEVDEHNIFSPVGKLNGTMGGEIVLKEDKAYPIATFHELRRSTMQSLLNAFSNLDKEDGAGIQILLRPAKPEWRKAALAVAQKKRKNEDKKTGFQSGFYWFKELIYAPVKPPENKKEEGKSESKPLSSIDQALVDGIEEKTKHPAFEVCIRVVASSSVPTRAQSICNSLVATFALYDSPGKNGFKYVNAKDIESFVTGYILRFFPPENTKMILNAVELATLFHFPGQKDIPTTQLERQQSKQVDGPRNIPEKGLALGYNIFRGSKKKINLDVNDRRRHLYAVGQTGTGKSTFLENLAYQDMVNGDGFAFIDPHGETVEKLLSLIPKERAEDVYYFCPSDMDYPMGLNMFEFHSDEQKDFLIQESLNMLYKLYDPNRQGIIGPRFERIFTNSALLLMSDPKGGTFVDIPKVLIDPDFMKSKLQYVTDQNVLDFWTKEWPNAQRSSEAGEVTSWVVSKFGAFLSNAMMRNIIGQTKSSFNLREIMDKKKILLVNLSKGKTGELNSKLLGMIFVMKFQAAAMSRADADKNERPDFCLYVDEFQNYSTDSFASILSEARKYGLNLIVANQFTTQLTEEIRDAIFGNVGSIVAFRVGVDDADFLARQFAPLFDMDDLQRIPNYNAVVRMLIGGVPTQPFSMAGLPYIESHNHELAGAVKQLSAAKYGRPRAIVEKEIFQRLKTEEKPKNGANNGMTPPGRPATGSSFLDDWLKKKESNSFRPPNSPFKQQAPNAPGPVQSQPPTQPQTNNTPFSHNAMPQSTTQGMDNTVQMTNATPASEAVKQPFTNDAGISSQAIIPAQQAAQFEPVKAPAQVEEKLNNESTINPQQEKPGSEQTIHLRPK